ncbi:hypothetical protein [Streptacidiphilus fuscans]|uniref:Uncharacterized protein n=1 Tax=Streptacidiphilus fuscans TaxID=2789292 RepID=A0A931B9E0_9ACTN|nr:hypothetical protein [Streptacidiphilus fuscans]MBF9069300.1 hypothetical protein [Streptacidiphilus fuscans]
MSVRRPHVRRRPRLVAATGVSALALAGAAATVLPAQAASAAPPLTTTVTVGNPVASGPLQPGGRAESFTVTVKNISNITAPFSGSVYVTPQGVLSLGQADVSVTETPIHAPATALALGTDNGGLTGSFTAKTGGEFRIPAHASYSWKFTLSATKAWPVNDNGFTVAFGGSSKVLDFKVGGARTGGPLTATLSGGDYLAANHPMYETLTVVNRTGAALKAPIWENLYLSNAGSDYQTVGRTDIRLSTWQNGHWVAWSPNNLPGLPYGLAAGASASITVRFQLVGQTMTTPTGHIELHIAGGVNGAVPNGAGTFDATRTFLVRR